MGPNLRPLHKGNRRTASCWMSWSLPVQCQLPFLLWSRSMVETIQKATQPYSYPGDAMVNGSNGNLIYVSDPVPAGFCSGSQAAGTSPRTAVLNVGLLDQRGGARPGATQHPTFVRRHIKGHHLGWLSRERQCYLSADRRWCVRRNPFSAAVAEYPW
jgi:hypothetical protein